MLTYLLAVAALLVAGLSLLTARRALRRLERLTEAYWELRYEHGQLRARLARIEGATEEDGDPSQMGSRPAATPPPGGSFIPLSSLKR